MLQMLQKMNDLGAKPHVNCRIVDYPYDWIFEPCRRSNLKHTSFSVSVPVYEISVIRPRLVSTMPHTLLFSGSRWADPIRPTWPAPIHVAWKVISTHEQLFTRILWVGAPVSTCSIEHSIGEVEGD